MEKLHGKTTKYKLMDPVAKETSNNLMQKIIEKDYLASNSIK
jgi:hypothetical protein